MLKIHGAISRKECVLFGKAPPILHSHAWSDVRVTSFMLFASWDLLLLEVLVNVDRAIPPLVWLSIEIGNTPEAIMCQSKLLYTLQLDHPLLQMIFTSPKSQVGNVLIALSQLYRKEEEEVSAILHNLHSLYRAPPIRPASTQILFKQDTIESQTEHLYEVRRTRLEYSAANYELFVFHLKSWRKTFVDPSYLKSLFSAIELTNIL